MSTNFLQNLEILKYPRTPHLEGSRLQKGDEGYAHVPYSRIARRYVVLEEKIDGGNSGVSFSPGAEQLLQSKGHYLKGGGRERQFALFKRWAAVHEERLLEALEDRFVLYGEWTHKKHSVFYDRLPHHFHEFDVWDRSRSAFLSTDARGALLKNVPVLPVPVLYRGIAPPRLADLFALVRPQLLAGIPQRKGKALELHEMIPPSLAKSGNWRKVFEAVVCREGFNLEKSWKQADKSDKAEGFYLKVEENGVVVERYKWVRPDFVQAIIESEVHHSQQPFVPNQLAEGVDIYAPKLTMTWEDLGLRTVEGF